MSAHTSAPWGTGQAGTASNPQRSVIALGPRGIGVAYGMSQEEADANARLFAASLELLHCVQETFDAIGDRLLSDTFGCEWVEKARAAIAKAGSAV